MRLGETELGFSGLYLRMQATWIPTRRSYAHSVVTCYQCSRAMVPRTRYCRGVFGYIQSGNYYPFCLSENWDGSAPSLGMQLFWLIGLGLGILLAILVGTALFKLQEVAGIYGKHPPLTLLTLAVAVFSGYRFCRWFVAWDGNN